MARTRKTLTTPWWVASQTSRSMVAKREETTASKVYTGISLT
jgi:hypothetical protein